MNNIRTQAQSITAKQALGVFFIALSLFTYFGGLNFVFTTSTLGCSLYVRVKDSETNQPVQGACVNLDGMDYQNLQYVTLNMEIGPTDSDGKANAGTSMWGTFYITVSKTGYETKSATLSGGEGATAGTTMYLTPVTEETPEEPEPTEPEDPEEPTDPEDPSTPEEPTDPEDETPSDDIPDDEGLTVIPETQMNAWRNMLSGAFATIGLGLLAIDLGERHRQ